MIHIIPIPRSDAVWLRIRDLPLVFFASREAAINMIDFYWVYICPMPEAA